MTRTRSSGIRSSIPAILAALTLAAPASLSAQRMSAADAEQLVAATPWNAWVGCWEQAGNRAGGASDASGRPGSESGPIVCVIPDRTSGAAEFVTIVDGEIAGRTRIEPTGRKIERTIDECSGWEKTAWSEDRRRIFLTTEFTCPGGLKRSSSSILAFSPSEQWLDIQGVTIAEETATRAVRYRRARLSSESVAGLPAEGRAAIELSRTLSASTARASASAPIDFDEIIEASRNLSSPVVSAWLVEQAQGFSVNGKALKRLDAEGVPTPVIDIVVALSHPRVFAINRADHTAEEAPIMDPGSAGEGHARRDARGQWGWSPEISPGFGATGRWVWTPYDYFAYDDLYFYRPYRSSGIRSQIFHMGGLPYYSTWSWYSGPRPIIVTPIYDRDDASPGIRRRVVNGRGYTREATNDGDRVEKSGRSARTRSPSAGSAPNTNTKVQPKAGSGSSSTDKSTRRAKPRGTD